MIGVWRRDLEIMSGPWGGIWGSAGENWRWDLENMGAGPGKHKVLGAVLERFRAGPRGYLGSLGWSLRL